MCPDSVNPVPKRRKLSRLDKQKDLVHTCEKYYTSENFVVDTGDISNFNLFKTDFKLHCFLTTVLTLVSHGKIIMLFNYCGSKNDKCSRIVSFKWDKSLHGAPSIKIPAFPNTPTIILNGCLRTISISNRQALAWTDCTSQHFSVPFFCKHGSETLIKCITKAFERHFSRQ